MPLILLFLLFALSLIQLSIINSGNEHKRSSVDYSSVMIINELHVQAPEKCSVAHRPYYDTAVYYSRQSEDAHPVGNAEMNEKHRRHISNRRQAHSKNKEGVERGNIVEVMSHGALTIRR